MAEDDKTVSIPRKELRKLIKANPDIAITDELAEAMKGSDLEAAFLDLWQAVGGPPLAREVKFYKDFGREWAFDFLHVETSTAFEVEGIGGQKSRHTTFKGYREDCIKYNEAAWLGYRVIRFPTGFSRDDVAYQVRKLKEIIRGS